MNINKQNILPNYVLNGEQNRYANKAMTMTVNDHKKIITLFEGKFGQFLNRNKGTDLSSPEAIIKVLKIFKFKYIIINNFNLYYLI